LDAVGGTEREAKNIYDEHMKDYTARPWFAPGLRY